jgi:hypothetical protein
MPRPSLVLVSGALVLAGCGAESTSDLFRAHNGPAGSSGASMGGSSGGFGAGGASGVGTGGLVVGTGGTSSGSGGVPTGGSVGNGGIIATGGFGSGPTGGTVASLDGGVGGLVGMGGVVASGGLVGTGGTGDTGGSFGSGGTAGSASAYAPGAAADCNGTPCNTANGDVCCVIVSNSSGMRTVYATCTPMGVACSIPLSARARCDGPEDCTEGSVCCGTLGAFPGVYTELGCVPGASCTGTGKQVMCHARDGSSCSGGVCNPTLTLPDKYGTCG